MSLGLLQPHGNVFEAVHVADVIGQHSPDTVAINSRTWCWI